MTGIMAVAPDDSNKLRKELRQKESDFTKEKAILVQKVHLLELQLKDANEREENQKRMHNAMMNCLQKGEDQQMEIKASATERATRIEIQELMDQKGRLLEQFDKREKMLKDQIVEKEQQLKDLQSYCDRIQQEKNTVYALLDEERLGYKSKIQAIQNDKDQISQKFILQNQQQVNQFTLEMEKLKNDQQSELSRIKNEANKSLKEIIMLHDQEKNNLEQRVDKAYTELKTLVARSNQDQSKVLAAKRREDLEKDVIMLQHEVEKIMLEWQQNVQQITLEKEKAQRQAHKALKQLEKLKNAPKPQIVDAGQQQEKTAAFEAEKMQQLNKINKNLNEEVQLLYQDNEKLNNQVKKLRKELLDSSEFIEQLEKGYKKLRLQQKTQNEVSTPECMDHIQQIAQKDALIKTITKQLEQMRKRVYDMQTIQQITSEEESLKTKTNCSSQSNNQVNKVVEYSVKSSHSPISKYKGFNQQETNYPVPYSQENLNMKQISQLELTLLRTCQKMADTASRMECAQCLTLYDTSDFYEHVVSNHPQISINLTKSQNIKRQSDSYKRHSVQNSNIQQLAQNNEQKDNNYPDEVSLIQYEISQTISPNVKHDYNYNQSKMLDFKDENPKTINNDQLLFDSSMSKFNASVKQTKRQSLNSHKPRNDNESTINYNDNDTSQQKRKQSKGDLQFTQILTNRRSSKASNSFISNNTNTMILGGTRTEIRDLKRQNKKLQSKVEEQNFKLNDVSKDCTALKKKVSKDSTGQLTSEIKGLLEKLVGAQAHPYDKLNSQRRTKPAIDQNKRPCEYSIQEHPKMEQSQLVPHDSSNMSYRDFSAIQQNYQHSKKQLSKSQINGGSATSRLHQKVKSQLNYDNKENQYQQVRIQTQRDQQSMKTPKLESTRARRVSHNNNMMSDNCATERRYQDLKDSHDEMNFDYQSYFQILQSINAPTMEEVVQNEHKQKTQRK